MTTELATRSDAGQSQLCLPLSTEGMAKALRMFSKPEPVNEYTRLINPLDADRIVASVDERLRPCTRSQSTTLVAQLIGCYPGVLTAKRNDDEQREFELWTLKLQEAFSVFSYDIGKAIVHGGTGVPSKQRYRPQPSDIAEFGQREVDKLQAVKLMAQRHKAEAARRGQQRIDDEKRGGYDENRHRRVQALVSGFKARAIVDPVAEKLRRQA